jgi:hypothetical protein
MRLIVFGKFRSSEPVGVVEDMPQLVLTAFTQKG